MANPPVLSLNPALAQGYDPSPGPRPAPDSGFIPATPGAAGTHYTLTQAQLLAASNAGITAAGASAALQGCSSALAAGLAQQLATESSYNPVTGTGTVPLSSVTGAQGVGQMLPGTAVQVMGQAWANQLASGQLDPYHQVLGSSTYLAQMTQLAITNYPECSPTQLVAVGQLYYVNGPGNTVNPVRGTAGGEYLLAQAAKSAGYPDTQTAMATDPNGTIAGALAKSGTIQYNLTHGSAHPVSPDGSDTTVSTGPLDGAGATRRPLSLNNDGSAYSPRTVIQDGLDNVPWWQLEGALVGNPNLRRVPDAVQFLLALPPRDTGSYLSTRSGRVVIRLNVGLISLGQGSAHQNSIEPTGTGLLLTLWDSKPDMLTGSGTTGAFMNLGGLTDLMSQTGSAAASAFRRLLVASLGGGSGVLNAQAAVLNQANGLRVAAQDAFMELWALFKNNGLIRYTLPEVQTSGLSSTSPTSQVNDALANLDTNLSGYQMRHRVGDIMNAGYVAMVYRDRTLLGQFKSFDLTANADSPYRWDFNFTFRVLSDFVPYNVYGT